MLDVTFFAKEQEEEKKNISTRASVLLLDVSTFSFLVCRRTESRGKEGEKNVGEKRTINYTQNNDDDIKNEKKSTNQIIESKISFVQWKEKEK